jgi:hypothetical protein
MAEIVKSVSWFHRSGSGGGHLRNVVLGERRGQDAEHLLPADWPPWRPVRRSPCLVANAQAVTFTVKGPAHAE